MPRGLGLPWYISDNFKSLNTHDRFGAVIGVWGAGEADEQGGEDYEVAEQGGYEADAGDGSNLANAGHGRKQIDGESGDKNDSGDQKGGGNRVECASDRPGDAVR